MLRELGISLPVTPELYCDNLSDVHLSANPAYHAWTKHFGVHYHYVRERVALGIPLVNHIPSHLQIADIFTKSLPYKPFCNLRFKLGIYAPPTPSLRGDISRAKTLAQTKAPSNNTKPKNPAESKSYVQECSNSSNDVVAVNKAEFGCHKLKSKATSTPLQRSPANEDKSRAPTEQKDVLCCTKRITLSKHFEPMGSDITC